MDIFNGLGQKQSSDLQDYLEIHPNTKTGVALSDDDLYLRLREYLPRYARLQHTPEYVKTVGTLSTHPNPFSFHYSADKRYISQYVRVFRLGRVKVDRARWIRMQNKGLFDYGHIIGGSPRAVRRSLLGLLTHIPSSGFQATHFRLRSKSRILIYLQA